jgi:23S rRNA G2445 N2-methylase RlmL
MRSDPTAAASSRGRRPLAEAVGDPSFTPRRRDLPALLELLGAADSRGAKAIEAAIARVGAVAATTVVDALADAEAPLRGRLVRLIGRFAAELPELVEPLLAALDDRDPKAQRNAIIALGKLDDPRVADALLQRAATETRLPHLRSLADALGKVGGEAALAWLRDLDDRGDRELTRIRGRAEKIAARSLRREEAGPSTVDLEAAVDAPMTVELRCRRGLEELLVAEIAARGILDKATIAEPGAIRGRTTKSARLGALWEARLALEVVFPLSRGRGPEARVIADALRDPRLRARLQRWTKGPLRYRLDLEGGHRRAAVWRVAEAVAAAAPELENDPTASAWEVRARRRGPTLEVSLLPKAVDDPRFAYRRGDVPAASHPTIAAALALLAYEGRQVDDDAVVWDPFVGSGLELCERGLLGPYAALWGSDVDPRALEVAAANLDAAGLARHELRLSDARTTRIPGGVSLILSNPPLGRRVHRGGAQDLLCEVLPNLAANLRRGGRLVWITPDPRRTRGAAEAAGLRLERDLRVDLGGFAGTIERWRRR